MFDRDAAVRAARAEVGTAYRHQGRASRVGLDCLGLVLVAAAAGGWRPINPRVVARLNYPARTEDDRFRIELSGEADLLGTRDDGWGMNSVLPGDLVLFQIEGAAFPRHVGIVTERLKRTGMLYFVHSFNGSGMCGTFEHGMTVEWVGQLMGFYRIKDSAPGLEPSD